MIEVANEPKVGEGTGVTAKDEVSENTNSNVPPTDLNIQDVHIRYEHMLVTQQVVVQQQVVQQRVAQHHHHMMHLHEETSTDEAEDTTHSREVIM